MPEETDARLIETIRALPAEAQRAVLSYALFLRYEEGRGRVQEDEAGWDQRFNDPERMARFAAWAEKSLAEESPELLDYSKL